MAAKKKVQAGGNSRFIAIIGVLAAVGIAALAYVITQAGPTTVALDPNAPPPSPQGYVVGSPDAPVEIIEFADFECPGCGQFAVVTEPQIMERLVSTGLARFRFVDFPIASIHPNTLVAHNAAACANDQGKFWEMKERIFYGQTEWSTQATGSPARFMKDYAKELGLNTGEFNSCLDSRRHQAQIDANRAEGERLRVPGTPAFVIGGKLIYGGGSYDALKAQVDSATAAVAAGGTVPAFGSKQ